MPTSDPDAVQVLARAMHTVGCLRGSRPGHSWSAGHHKTDADVAALVLAEAANGGYALSPTGGSDA